MTTPITDLGDGTVRLPGLVNAHVHSFAIPLLRGLSEDDPRDETMYTLTAPALGAAIAALSEDDIAALTDLALAEQLLAGVTTVVENSLADLAIFIDRARHFGIRAFASQLFNDSTGAANPHAFGETGAASLAGVEHAVGLFRRYDGDAAGRIRITLGPHAPDTCSPELLEAIRLAALETGASIVIHACQGDRELSAVAAAHSGSPIDYLDRHGLLGERTLLAHMFLATADDERLVAARGASIAHCPTVIAKRGIGGRYARQLAAGIPVAIGTDSYGGDVLGQLRIAAYLGKLDGATAAVPTATDVLASATTAAGPCLGAPWLGDGERDWIELRADHPAQIPWSAPAEQVVYYGSSRDVATVVVDDVTLVEEGRLAGHDLGRIRSRGIAAAEKGWHAMRQAGWTTRGTASAG